MKARQARGPRVAAAKAGFSTAAAYRFEQDKASAIETSRPRERRRLDPLATVWAEEVLPILEAAPGLGPVAIFQELQRRHPELDPEVRRTLKRRIRDWRAVHGPDRAVVFRQEHPSGRLGLSDFTDMTELFITLAGLP